MASFEEKVAALRRLRDKMEARQEQGREKQETSSASEQPRQPASLATEQDSRSDADANADLPMMDQAPPIVPSVASNTAPAERVDPAAKGGAGEADALFCAGHCLEHGIHGCEVDLERAAEMYEGAAEGGHPAAMWRLGELLERGLGVEQDACTAFAWYSRAADEGFVQAQSSLALLLEEGRGCEVDEAEALRWHLAAAESGHMLSQYCAAMLFLEGRGIAQDEALGMKWLRKSADAGFGPAVRVLKGTRPGDTAGAFAESDQSDDEIAADDDDDGGNGDPLLDRAEGSNFLALARSLTKHLQDLDVEDAQALLDELLEMPELSDPVIDSDGPCDDSFDFDLQRSLPAQPQARQKETPQAYRE
mmetsp:Transcript_34406/g.73285  ORF Transcript_34406/g.73285 Transcript_34406/m.73285 type:complete len:363 (+) Transcript_34406:147-1235(+)|eukprot:CAMPEP_0206436144 /NCGR_PEP_ID=MMETSP0324_2-20121206/10309_1 /ASSEMBLY_ACC=CAM_ASM_000836 /TAXON_ID=2866 /ORGANISM="Crypthecodinium cohnii, Strain Seligo" /LENGTH=362 /DNA_ID=CAMNT_0053903255 /DNA_START=82 /DNA_END=1170 /DNA_ORIENTATION=-